MLFNKVHIIFFILSIYHRFSFIFKKISYIKTRNYFSLFYILKVFTILTLIRIAEKDRNLVGTKCQKGDK